MKRAPLLLRDRAILGLLGFFVLVAFTLELYWLRHSTTLVADAEGNWMAKLFRIYGACDRAYFEAPSPLTLTLEGLNVYFTQALGLLIMWGIVKRRPWRYPLQLAVGAYVSYSVVLYFLTAQVGGFADMRERSLYGFALFYGVNLPWLAAHLYLVLDAGRAITARFALGRFPPAQGSLRSKGTLAGEGRAVGAGQAVRRAELGPARVVVDDEAAGA